MDTLLESLATHIFTVGEYVELINGLIVPLDTYVEGEVTGYKEAGDWIFFDLKDTDTKAVLGCGLHRSGLRRIGVIVEDGMRIKVRGHGKLTPKSGRFGFWVDEIELMGEGTLKRAYELLRKKLTEDGLFERKRPIPECIRHIGVISSRDGVVIHDLMKNLDSRGFTIQFLHSGVDGEKAADSLVKAIEHFSLIAHKPDVLVIIRGGGSLASLAGFNNETVCRAIFACPVPVLVGIGHDVDVPLAALTADISASTPTAVATVINESWQRIDAYVPELKRTICEAFLYRFQSIEHDIERSFTSIHGAFQNLFGRFERYASSVMMAYTMIEGRITEYKKRAEGVEQLLQAYDPVHMLERGFSLVYAPDGTLVRSVDDVEIGEMLALNIADGSLHMTVASKEKSS